MSAQEFHDGRVTLHGGDCLDVLDTLPDNSVDSVVCDPPYHLTSIVKRFGGANAAPAKDYSTERDNATGAYARASRGFMGKQWDGGDIAFRVDLWTKVLRVLKPGGHLVAFSGTRTYHRMAVAIEDAGFEIRDQLAWVYGSGFPKSHDVSKAIDKARKDVGAIRVICRALRAEMDRAGVKSDDLTKHFGDCHARLIDHWAARDTDSQPSLPTPAQWAKLVELFPGLSTLTPEADRLNARKGEFGEDWKAREVTGHVEEWRDRSNYALTARDGLRRDKAATDAARAWEGWGTALKPAWEPICLARKPLSEKTVAANVLAHGVGALNIDGCRIEGAGNKTFERGAGDRSREQYRTGTTRGPAIPSEQGRFPANLCHDGSDEVVAMFPANDGDSGSPARFFYSAKADANDRLASKHPTVKPVDLMRWLVRLVTPPRGVVLDFFAGTGTTAHAALLENMRAIIIEREEEYRADIARRMALVFAGPDEKSREIVKASGKVEDAGPLFSF